MHEAVGKIEEFIASIFASWKWRIKNAALKKASEYTMSSGAQISQNTKQKLGLTRGS
jgi:hypothetical protein